MRKYFTIAMAFIVVTACNNNQGAGSGSSDSTKINSGDSALSTTTTSTVVHHKYSGKFAPQPNMKYLDLKTRQEITVKIDTVRGAVVNQETDEPVDLFVEPEKHDTIYGQTGSVVNNYIFKDESGGYRVDTVRINTVQVQTVAVAPETTSVTTGRFKEKEKKRKTKEKTDEEKIKEKNGKTKEKER